ncbi:hypothetical protein [Citrobacter sp. JGM124]|uniref:hypothetical protein n=1 Tax=Citrobacter sp. JGM124 TaxID=2799789 RepID=UPI001BAB2A77|nr:hypothetical protein [Citrobacter sp. JGM124]MBS0847928.1 hypothetical protein [Citrobacter sp. JGM124]
MAGNISGEKPPVLTGSFQGPPWGQYRAMLHSWLRDSARMIGMVLPMVLSACLPIKWLLELLL